ncbi:MAG TPA: CPBP family intramembrane glutamic endopeptidase [Vicinamibacterales bacterium]|nr:CPBP family intramembrane glutamic endopeptidase [Vicinamibacterales bacterium]
MRALVLFFAATYATSWASWLAAMRLQQGAAPNHISAAATALLYLGTFAPALIALLTTAVTDGRAGVAALIARLVQARAGIRWYVFAIGYVAATKLGAAVLYRATAGAWPAFGAEPLVLVLFAIPFGTPSQAGEEIGWRGYALPRIASRVGFAPASVILGALWGAWHLPLFFVPGVGNFGQSFPVFAIMNMALSIAIAWLYVNTGGSLLIAMLMHSAVNQTNGIVPTRRSTPGMPWRFDTSTITLMAVALFVASAVYLFAQLRRLDRVAVRRADGPCIQIASSLRPSE